MKITHIAKRLYLEGNYELRDNSTTNWASIVDFPTVFTAVGRGVQSGNWQSCTAINTPYSLGKFAKEEGIISTESNYDIAYPNLTETERYEFAGLTYAIASLSEAWSVTHGGNHGTSKGVDIKSEATAEAIKSALKVPMDRANELLDKMRGNV